MSVVCTIGKDGKKYYFKDGQRVPSSQAKNSSSCKKKAASSTKGAPKRAKATTKPVPKRVTQKSIPKAQVKPEKTKKYLWLMKEIPVYKTEAGKFTTDVVDGRIELIGEYPLKYVRSVDKYDLEKDLVEELKTDSNYWVVDSEDRAKILKMDEYTDPRKLKIKNYLNRVWEFGDLKVMGKNIPTFKKHVSSYFGPKGPKKVVRERLPKGKKLVWAEQKIHDMMSEILTNRATWSAKQWDAFLENILVNGYILSNLHPIS